MSKSEATSTIEEDKELLSLLKQDDEKGLELIFDRYYKYLVVTAYKMLNDDHQARDLVQDVFFKFWEKRNELDIQISLKAYLRRAVVNKVLDEMRKRKRMVWSDEVVEYNQGTASATALEQLQVQDLQKTIDTAIENLPERCRQVFSLSRFENLSHKSIAQELGISVKTIESQMTKALKVIRKAVDNHGHLLWISYFLIN